jgi:hypothetical protein
MPRLRPDEGVSRGPDDRDRPAALRKGHRRHRFTTGTGAALAARNTLMSP